MSSTHVVTDEEAAKPLPASPPARRRWLRLAAIVAVCALTWAWLVRHADLGTLAAQVVAVSAWVWAAAGCAQLAGYALRARRLQAEWREAGAARWRTCMRLVLLHNAAVLMLPLRSGEAGYVWLVHRQWGVTLRAAATSLLRWRIQDASVLGAAVVLLLPISWPLRVVLLLAATALFALVLPRFWPALWRGLEVTVAQWVFKLAGAALVLSQLAGLPWDIAARAALGGELGTAQPLQPPAGLGVYEGGVWIAGGAPHGPALISAALAVHAFALCVALAAASIAQLIVPASEEGRP